ncbi:trans-aconitate 2-methyltransferase [Streptomyces sp. NPDC049906]|uniref:trans-aconitate 2-methyltransferase n=1 Tax=Streptomyces sp. NPDC049906 TaxID=3155656 RepID=UPI003437A274
MPTTTPVWDPHQYLRHAGHRGRAFVDLLARVPELPGGPAPRIADLGCGAGNVTALLAERWPTARITGYDASPAMLDRARTLAGPTAGGGHLDFAPADAGEWAPDPADPPALLISNALLHWVPGHAERFADWIAGLVPGGTFAFQVPGNFDAPSHVLLRELADSPRWRARLDGVLRHEGAVRTPAAYLDVLTRLGCAVDAWETTYAQVLTGEDPVLDWVAGTTLRPVLTALDADPTARDAFLDEYRTALRRAYPPAGYGTVFPFRRIFVVARTG